MNPEVAYASLLETSAAVGQIVLIALLLERALAFVFEYHWFQQLTARVEGIKAPVAFGLALLIARTYGVDILAELFREEGAPATPTWIGSLLTAAIIAGGSSAAIAIFQNRFNWGRDARKAGIEAKKRAASASLKEAEAREAAAASELEAAKTREITQRAERLAVSRRIKDQLGDDALNTG